MSIDTDTIRKISKLARIEISEDRLEPMAEELSNIIGWIEQLQEVDITDTPPMSSTVDACLPMREDTLTEEDTGGGRSDDLMANAPSTEANFYVVPKVVE